jgi:hypothetical protein
MSPAAEPGVPGGSEPTRFAIRLDSIDSLFYPFDATPIAERTLSEGVRNHLLDAWEQVRHAPPPWLTVQAPASDRERTDEAAVRAAISADLKAAFGPLRGVDPLTRSDRVAATIGIALLFVCIAISTWLDQMSNDVIVQGASQGILLLGWVALWLPAERLVRAVLPHFFNRRRFAEFAEIEVRFAWYPD